jgi:hypothetical protein
MRPTKPTLREPRVATQRAAMMRMMPVPTASTRAPSQRLAVKRQK